MTLRGRNGLKTTQNGIFRPARVIQDAKINEDFILNKKFVQESIYGIKNYWCTIFFTDL